jgi:hypothetical protein
MGEYEMTRVLTITSCPIQHAYKGLDNLRAFMNLAFSSLQVLKVLNLRMDYQLSVEKQG